MTTDSIVEFEVRSTLDRLNQAFATHDVKACLELFALEQGTVFIASEADETAVGSTQLTARIKELFDRRDTYSWDWRTVYVSSVGSVAWLIVTDSLIHVDSVGGVRESFPYRLSAILEKRGEKWMWVHFHGSEPTDG